MKVEGNNDSTKTTTRKFVTFQEVGNRRKIIIAAMLHFTG